MAKNNNYVTERTKQQRLEQERRKKAQRVNKILIPTLIAVAAIVALALIIWGVVSLVKYIQANDSIPDLTVTHHASLEIEGYGTVHIELYGNEAPETVANFVKLANEGFYDGLTFHRIMDGFMAQGGGFDKDGKEKDADTIYGEFKANGFNNNIPHVAGTISMARTNVYNSASSQFFIVDETSENNSYSLDGKYAAFGKVTSGLDIINKLCDEIKTGDNGAVEVANRPVIKSISIHASH
ncbi:MAG: peptidylprolyl isomerase [Clostridia bacterium]|nr:peptidylprolyl isomerase [Clostridia bacterium]